MKEKISITLERELIEEIDSFVDGIRIRNRSQAIEFLLRKSLSEKRTAVILAGGEEEKLKVNGVYKPILEYKGCSAIEHIVKNLRKYRFTEIYIIGRKHVLSEIFKVVGDGNEYGVEIKYIEEKPLKPVTKQDTARTLKLINGKIKKPFLCIYCDVIFDFDLNAVWNFHLKSSSIATLIVKTSPNPQEWGNIELEGEYIVEFIEKPKKAKNYLVFSGVFIASPELLAQQGNSLEYEIFPNLAKKRLLTGYVISGFCEHVDKLIKK